MRTHIMVHHSLTADGATVSWGAIEKYHVATQGWGDIGYHAGVELVGDRYYAMVGRGEHLDAAACKEGQMNRLALHVCCVGNYDTMEPPGAMLTVLVRRILVPWMIRYGIARDHVIGHRDWATYKSCPGTKFDLKALRAYLP